MPAKKSAKSPATKTAKSPPKKSAAKAVKAVKAVKAPKAPQAPKPPKSKPYDQGPWAPVFAPRAPGERRYWLIKSEPDVFSLEHLRAAPGQTTCWDNVRNSGARNFLRDGMKVGDLAFYYHSNADPSAIVGVCEVVREGYPDPGAFDPSSDYFDPASHPDMPTWFMVDVRYVSTLPRAVPLQEIKDHPTLSQMALVKVGRLSVVPVSAEEWRTVIALSETG